MPTRGWLRSTQMCVPSPHDFPNFHPSRPITTPHFSTGKREEIGARRGEGARKSLSDAGCSVVARSAAVDAAAATQR